jgi:hypothetical protein
LAAGLDRVDLDREEPFQRRGQPQVLLAGLIEQPGQGRGGIGHLQIGQVRAEPLVEPGLGHRPGSTATFIAEPGHRRVPSVVAVPGF